MDFPPIAMLSANDEARRTSSNARAFALSPEEVGQFLSFRNASVRRQIESVVDWLDVETAARYQPTATETFCNVYAHDVCFLLGVYLPRVWWTNEALRALKRGRIIDVSLGYTVVELSSNAIFEWLEEHGAVFGWQRLADAAKAQGAANAGKFVLVCGKAEQAKGHGHIAIILPERPSLTAKRVGGTLLNAVQSDAGRTNRKASVLDPWWLHYPKHAFWVGFPKSDIDLLSRGEHVTRPRRTVANGILGMAAKLILPSVVAQVDAKMVRLASEYRFAPALSSHFVDALIAGEDKRFLLHGGFDILAICRALLRLIGGGPLQGASTVEQQLVRTLTNRRARTIWRKLTEIMLAAHSARRFPKAEIATAYLRAGYYGWRMNGVRQACRRLGIDPVACSADEACDVIAALRHPLPKNPTAERVSRWRGRSAYLRRRLFQARSQ